VVRGCFPLVGGRDPRPSRRQSQSGAETDRSKIGSFVTSRDVVVGWVNRVDSVWFFSPPCRSRTRQLNLREILDRSIRRSHSVPPAGRPVFADDRSMVLVSTATGKPVPSYTTFLFPYPAEREGLGSESLKTMHDSFDLGVLKRELISSDNVGPTFPEPGTLVHFHVPITRGGCFIMKLSGCA
jgi:hypothetical protein